jgi:hypothetical protein
MEKETAAWQGRRDDRQVEGEYNDQRPAFQAPATFTQQLEAIVDSNYSAIEKLILLKIRFRANHRTLSGAYPSIATLMRSASVKDDRTIRETVKGLEKGGILTREERPGKSSVYGLSKERLQELITEHIFRSREKKEPLPVDGRGREGGPLPVDGRGEGRPLPFEDTDPSHGMGGDLERDLIKRGGLPLSAASSSRPIERSRQKARTNGAAAMVAALSPEAAYAYDNVRVEKGALVIGEALRADLRGEGYADADIDLALPRALDRAGLATDPVKLLRGVRWALSYVRQDKAKLKAVKPSTKGTSRYAT